MRKLVPPALIFLAFGVYFALQTCPTFYFWDSAELTAAVLKDGVPHPPGFPLLLLLAKIWTALVPLEKAFGLNLFSGFFAAVGLAVWYLVIVKVLRYLFVRNDRLSFELLSTICIIIMGISYSFSLQATRFEVYSLNFFMIAALVYLTQSIVESDKKPIALYLLFSVVAGLSMGVHLLTIVLVIPGLLLYLYLNKKADPLNLILILALAFMIAAPLYLTLIFLARNQPLLNWGDPSNAGRFYAYLFAKEFKVDTSSFNLPHLFENISFVLKLLARQFGVPGVFLAAIGLVIIYFKKIALGIGLSIIIILNVFSSVFAGDFFYENLDLHGYHIISLGVVALSAAMALVSIYNFVRKKAGRKNDARTDLTALAIAIIISAFIFAVPVMDNFLSGDLSDVDGRRYAESVLADAPADAAVFTSYYNTYFCLMAYKAAYDLNNNQTIQCIYNWDHRWGREQAAALFDRNIPIDTDRQSFYREILNRLMRNRPVYIEYDNSSRPIAKYLIPRGSGYLFVPQDTLSVGPEFINEDISFHLKEASKSGQIEWIKTWTLWFNNRGEYFERRDEKPAAESYFAARDKIAAGAYLK